MQAVHLAAKVLIFRIIRYRPKLGLQSVRTSLHAGVLAAGSGQRADRVDSPLTCGPETQEAVTTVYVLNFVHHDDVVVVVVVVVSLTSN